MSTILVRAASKVLSVVCIFVLAASTSCSLKMWPFNESSPAKHQNESGDAAGGAKPIAGPARTENNVDLKQAQAWNRMNELEDEIRTQKERIKLLEQGLLTGIAPSDLRQDPKQRTKLEKSSESVELPAEAIKVRSEGSDSNALHPPVLDLPEGSSQENASDVANSPDSYRVRVQVAKEYLQGSRFGMAVAELAQITRDFGTKAGDGEAKFLMGRAYLGLKEYATSRGELEGFLKQFPKHALEAPARLELARAYFGLNLRERSRRELALIAREYPGTEEADMATNEMRKLKGSL